MAGAGFKNFTTGEVLTASDVQGYLMDQSVMVFAGTAARASAIPSPSEGMVTYRSDDDAVEVYDGSAWNSIGGVGAAVISSPAATGSYSSGGTTYNYYTFTASGTLTVDKAGFADMVIVGGGGSGGNYHAIANCWAAGGGAGGMADLTDVYLAADTYTVVVGAGGASNDGHGANGESSKVGPYVGVGGGGGAGNDGNALAQPGFPGGSGGGSMYASNPVGVSGQGNQGGAGTGVVTNGGGGGGAGAAGTNGSGTTGGNGGNGKSTSITGSAQTLAGGGGGSGSTARGTAGSGGGGLGCASTGTGSAGTANTGGGGGGGRSNLAYSGGSGIVIVRVAV